MYRVGLALSLVLLASNASALAETTRWKRTTVCSLDGQKCYRCLQSFVVSDGRSFYSGGNCQEIAVNMNPPKRIPPTPKPQKTRPGNSLESTEMF